jgi:uncharacterized protein YecT (DUF1311 family)
MRRGLLVAGLAAFLPPALHAQRPATAARCERPDTQAEMNACAARDFNAADRALNQEYARLVASIHDTGRRDRLRAAERAWIAYRDAQCAFEASAMEGGTAAPLLFSGCAAQLTRERTKELRDAREANVYE